MLGLGQELLQTLGVCYKIKFTIFLQNIFFLYQGKILKHSQRNALKYYRKLMKKKLIYRLFC